MQNSLWYQFYFLTERGRTGLAANRRDIARIMWTCNSQTWFFDNATFDRSASAFDNPDYVDVVIHSYFNRVEAAPEYSQYDDLEKRLADHPPITVPTTNMDGMSTAAKFTGERQHHVLAKVRHDPPPEARAAFAAAFWEFASRRNLRSPFRKLL
jgi:hypothetical protein